MRETITMTEEENSQLVTELAQAETEANVHHRQTAENTESLCLELAHLRQTIEHKESRDWRKTQEELAMIKAEQMQLRSNLANAQDIVAARQSLSDNVQVLIDYQTHFQTSRDKCRFSVFKKLTKMFKSDKPKKTKAGQNERLREQSKAIYGNPELGSTRNHQLSAQKNVIS
jgi:DNA polymerase III psi subunit